nr:exportin-7 [Quercus suber]
MGGLANDDNYHAFCHLLGQFKVNYQVTLTICSLNRCIQLLLLRLMSSVWLNCILLIGYKIHLQKTHRICSYIPSLSSLLQNGGQKGPLRSSKHSFDDDGIPQFSGITDFDSPPLGEAKPSITNKDNDNIPDGSDSLLANIDRNRFHKLFPSTTSLDYFQTWPNCTLSEGNYLINYLATRGPNLEPFVVGSLIQLLCRVTLFGWLDEDRFKEVMNFLSQAAYHCATVLKILNQLVSKMSQVKLSLVRCLHHQLLLGCLITLQY